MAVKTIRRISSWTLYIVVFINIAVFGIFFFGGEMKEILVPNIWNPVYIGTLITWLYILLGLCITSMLAFGLTQFINKLIHNPKASLQTFAVFAGVGLLLFLAYYFADDTPFPMTSINEDTRQFNVEFWLKVIDMWIFSIIGLISIAAAVIIWGSLKKSFGK